MKKIKKIHLNISFMKNIAMKDLDSLHLGIHTFNTVTRLKSLNENLITHILIY